MSVLLFGGGAENAAKTACVRGHEFTPENTYDARGKRECRACHRGRQRRYRAEKWTPPPTAVPGEIPGATRANAPTVNSSRSAAYDAVRGAERPVRPVEAP